MFSPEETEDHIGDDIYLELVSSGSVNRTRFHLVFINSLSRWLRQWRIRLQCGRPGFDPWVGKIPWRRAQQPTPVFFMENLHGQRSLVGYSPWGCKESDRTEWWSNQGLLALHKDNHLTGIQITTVGRKGVKKRFPNLGEASLSAWKWSVEFIKCADFWIPLQEFINYRSSPQVNLMHNQVQEWLACVTQDRRA